MWLFETKLVSEMMLLRPGPRVAGLLGRIADEGLGFASVTVRAVLDRNRRLNTGLPAAEVATTGIS